MILVGDAMMAPRDLVSHTGQISGWDWLMRIKARYPHVIWLHPQPAPQTHSYWTGTFELDPGVRHVPDASGGPDGGYEKADGEPVRCRLCEVTKSRGILASAHIGVSGEPR